MQSRSVVLSSGSSITDSGINGLLSALQATDNISKGVEEWNPKDDPHAQVLVWTLYEHSGPQGPKCYDSGHPSVYRVMPSRPCLFPVSALRQLRRN